MIDYLQEYLLVSLTFPPVVAAVKQEWEPSYFPKVTNPGMVEYFNCNTNKGTDITKNWAHGKRNFHTEQLCEEFEILFIMSGILATVNVKILVKSVGSRNSLLCIWLFSFWLLLLFLNHIYVSNFYYCYYYLPIYHYHQFW